MSLPRTFGRRNHQQQQHLEQDVDLGHDPGGRLSFSVSSKNSPIPMRTNAFTVLPPLSPQIPGPPPTPKPYRCRPPQLAKKENSAFVILTEIARARTPSPPGGRVSPFRGRGFKPGNSRHASPSPDPKSKAGGHSPRSKQARIVKGITVGKSAPSSPSKRSNIPKPIVPRRTSLSPNRAKEIVDRNSKDSNGNLLQVNGGGYLDRRDTFNKKPPPTPNRRIKSPVRIELPDIGSKTTKMPVSILKSPKKPVPDKNNNPVNVKTNLNRSRSRNDSNMNRRNLNLREGKENAALIKKPPTREVNINVPRSPNMNAPRSPGRTATNDPGKRSLNQKPPLPPTDTKTRQKPGSSPSPNPKKRVPLVPSKNMATVSSNNSKLNIQKPNNINNKSRSSSPTKPNIRPRSKTPVNNSKNDDIKKTDRGGGNINNKTVNNNNNNKSSNKIDKNSNKNNKSNTNGDVLRSNAGDSDNNNITNLTKSPKKEVDGKKPVSGGVEPAKVEVVNERKTNDKKIGSPTKSRPSSAKSPVSKRAEKDASTQESSMSTMKTGTAGASSMVVPVEPNISPKVTTMTTTSTVNEKEATSSSSKIPSPVKRVNQVQNQSAESVRSSSSRETIRAVARVKGTVNSTASQRRSKVTSVAGKVKGGPDLEVLSANTLMSDSNHTGSRMAWTDSPSRPTEELTNQTTTSVKPTGCLGNICKLLNCCRCCQNWQKKPRPAAAVGADVSQKPSPLERLNCFKKCPSLNLGDRIGSMCGKLNCCRKLNLSGCCKGRGLSSCCQKLSCCSSCCRRRSSSISEDDSSDISSDEPKIKCANLKSCWRFAFCLNRACCQRVRQMCRCRNLNCCKPGGCCGRISPEEEAMRKKKNSKAAFRRSKTSSIFSEIPKLDTTFVEYNSIMRGAIPVLPVPVAWMCLILNFVLPGVGTLWSGLMCLYFGKPRFSVNDTPLARIGSFCINIMVAFAQMFTVLFCLVGWGWAIWWGVIMLRLARKHRRIKLAEAGAPPESRPTPVVLNQNHADAERGQP